VAGAATVALFFLVVDLIAGRGLWTPFALGAAFFQGAFPPPGAPVSPALVGGYTVVHVWLFLSVGVLASFLLTGRRIPGASLLSRSLLLGALLFVAFEVIFVFFARLVATGAIEMLGLGRVAFANLLAALVMAAVLALRSERRGDATASQPEKRSR